MISKEMLIKKIDEIIDAVNEPQDREGFDLDSEKDGFPFAIRCLYIADNCVITFGGYDIHFEIFNVEVCSTSEIVEKFFKYIVDYNATNLNDYVFSEPETLQTKNLGRKQLILIIYYLVYI